MAEANLTSEDLYAILELTNTANSDDIRRSYQRLAKQWHPDKLSSSLSEEDRASATERFHRINRAYEILSDDLQRQSYDRETKQLLLTQKWPISSTVDLDDMTYDPNAGSFSSPCRCSGCYVITEEEMEMGVDTVNCSMCTLSIRVLYHEANDED